MPSAEIIAIGTELLLGEILDTNTQYLARTLRDNGIDLYRTSIVGDNIERVARAIRDACQRAEIVITTGGLGPTVDDPTREAVAFALNTEIEYHEELWDQVVERFNHFGRQATENNRRQAFLPKDSLAIENPVGTAPAFISYWQNNIIICLPGVPREMEYLMINAVVPYLQKKYKLHGIIKARVLHTVGAGESQVDEWIGDLEKNDNPTVGLLAHPGQVDVRITAKADTLVDADSQIQCMEEIIRERLGNIIYGCDDESIEEIINKKLNEQNIKLVIIECGLNGLVTQRLKNVDNPIIQSILQQDSCVADDLKRDVQKLMQHTSADAGLGVCFKSTSENQELFIVFMRPLSNKEITRHYGGHPINAISWAVITTLGFIHNCLIEN